MHDDDPHPPDDKRLTGYIITDQFRDDFKTMVSQQRTIIQLLRQLTTANAKDAKQMAAIDDELTALQTSVTNNTNATTAAEALIGGISAQIAAAVAAAQAAGATPAQLAEITALQTSIDTNTTGLAAAVTANTTPPPSTGTSGTTGATPPAGGTPISAGDTAAST